ncbi:ubiquinone/menaquinone biosynthesisC-methyltransferase UbiE [Striga asiatica]|uniref:Ubiquinone/menaquinone biosynthesisC-methyltransferase UbiE n=1 Tax=Striga asiatica TaxID=4170 RepID=A0A5A7RI19_STRAF|nr:ubiquinone/menaquinone biosynthesisC-methyltransferase UbiE [Striga asiatica]
MMNDFMSGGRHKLWKERLILKLDPFPGMKHLHVAGGTSPGNDKSLVWVEGDAEALKFEDKSMDGYTFTFGINNVTRIEKALSKAHRYLNGEADFFSIGKGTWNSYMVLDISGVKSYVINTARLCSLMSSRSLRSSDTSARSVVKPLVHLPTDYVPWGEC